MGWLGSERIQREHRDSADTAGLFEIRRAEGAELHSTELRLKDRRAEGVERGLTLVQISTHQSGHSTPVKGPLVAVD
jgi:hypothetical protein